MPKKEILPSVLCKEARDLLNDSERYIGADVREIIDRLMVAYEEERAQRIDDPVKEELAKALLAWVDIKHTHDEECHPSEGKHSMKCYQIKLLLRQSHEILAHYKEE